MAIEIKTNIDFKRISDELRQKHRTTLEAALEEEITELQERTQSGRDVKGKAFKPLSNTYKAYKIKTGRKGIPNLTFSGDMLRSITSRVEDLANGLLGRIFFTSQAEALKAKGNQKLRKFFELSDKQIQNIKDKLQGK